VGEQGPSLWGLSGSDSAGSDMSSSRPEQDFDRFQHEEDIVMDSDREDRLHISCPV
jgi:hypothetical protein